MNANILDRKFINKDKMIMDVGVRIEFIAVRGNSEA